MSGLVRLVVRLYALLVRLYPPGFRANFSEELQAVFAKAAAEAAGRGVLSLVKVCLWELRDWPVTLVREHWFSFRHGRKDMSMNVRTHSNNRGVEAVLSDFAHQEVSPWRDVVLAGLPHLLVAFFGGASQMAYGLLPEHIYDRLTGFFVVFGVVFFILA